MLPPQLRQASGVRPCLRQPKSVHLPIPTSSIQASGFTYWHKKRDWLFPSDPFYETHLRKRSISTRAELKRTLRRQEKWDKVTPVTASWERRHASHSKKGPRRPSQDGGHDNESFKSLREARKLRVDQIRERFDAKFGEDPYEAVFGKRFEPFWKRLTPDFLKQELAWQTPVETKVTAEAGAPPSTPTSKSRSFAQSRSFEMRTSHSSGSKPHVEASSSSWDSESNKTRRATYDPVSGRMVEVDGATSSPSYKKPANLSTLPQEDIDSMTADNVRASMGKTKKQNLQKLAARTEQLAALEEDYKNKTFNNEHDELVEARKTLEALRAQVQILERKAHGSTLTKPDIEDAERPAFFEGGWNDAPQGMQIAFENEKDSYSRSGKKSLEQEMNALNSEQVQEINDGYEPSPTGMQTQFEKEDPTLFQDELSQKLKREEYDDGYSNAPTGMQTQHETEDPNSLEQELNKKLESEVYEDGYSQIPTGMQTQHEREDPTTLEEELNKKLQREVYDDGYSNTPTGMQTQHKAEDPTTLEQELNENLPREVYDDGYSNVPVGMQTQHQKEDSTMLEQELNKKLQREVYDDGYSNVPSGMQTQHQNEEASTLEQELNKKLQREVYDDGYSNIPSGMQTQHKQEHEDVLENELNENLKRKEYDDGYSTEPIGMQTQHEREGANILEQDLAKLNKLKHEIYEDGYSNAPTGMQTQHENEGADVLENDLAKLQNLKREIYDDGYSTDPKGMQGLFEQEQIHFQDGRARSLEQEMQEKLKIKAYDDGYSTAPIGLQTAYNTERQDSTRGKRETLEQEMRSKLEDVPADSGYATMPIGLQVLFRQEQQEAQNNKGQSLEDELKAVRIQELPSQSNTEPHTQKNISEEKEDGYSRVPTGMQNSFRNEEVSASASQQGGEGDLCRNVGKFCNSRRWYKQSASNNLSEELQKAHKKMLDCGLVREVQNVYETTYGPITTEHRQPVIAPADSMEGTVDETVHKALHEHDQGDGAKVYEFKEDNLEHELGEKLSSTSNITSKQASEPQVKWAEPAIYKVVAYDVNKESISITTTPSNFSTSETPLTISNALSRLHQPARFIPYFAELQKAGYQVIHASRDWLVLRKVDLGDKAPSVTETITNPIDPKMSRNIPFEEPILGRFASPTGFVNYDPIFPPEPPKPEPAESETVTVEIPVRNGGADATERPRQRRIRREEDVFSGRQRWRERRGSGPEKRERGEKRTFKDRAVWALSVGVTAAGLLYAVGVAGELSKKQ